MEEQFILKLLNVIGHTMYISLPDSSLQNNLHIFTGNSTQKLKMLH